MRDRYFGEEEHQHLEAEGEMDEINQSIGIFKTWLRSKEAVSPTSGIFYRGRFNQLVQDESIMIAGVGAEQCSDPFKVVHHSMDNKHFFQLQLSPMFARSFKGSFEQREELMKRLNENIADAVELIDYISSEGGTVISISEYRQAKEEQRDL